MGGTSTSLAPDVRKAGGAAISSLTAITNNSPLRGIGQYGAYGESTFTWSDGSPNPFAFLAHTGIQHYSTPDTYAIGEGFSFTVPADAHPRRLTMYFDTHLGVSGIQALLDDHSGFFDDTFDSQGGQNVGGIFTLDYASDSGPQRLTVTGYLGEYGRDTTRYANFAIQGVTLAIVPEPAAIGFIAAGGLLCRSRRRQPPTVQS